MPFPDETESKMIQLVSRAERAEARVAELERELALTRGDNILLRQEVRDLRRNDPDLNRE